MNTPQNFSSLGPNVIASLSGNHSQYIETTAKPTLPLLIQAADPSLDVFSWAEQHKSTIKQALSSVGAILFRNFPLRANDDFIRLGECFTEQWLPYVDRASKRTPINGPVFTSTDTPSRFDIPLHNESSFTNRWPETIFFFCHKASLQGGRTPIVDIRKVYQQIEPSIKSRIERQGVLYVRNFGQATGMDWRETFQVNSREELEHYSQESAISLEWLENDKLRIYQIRPGVVEYPKTGEKIWFNHALALHYTSLDSALQKAFLSQYGELGLPHNTYFGDGKAFSNEEIQHIRDIYRANTVCFDWQPDDLLVLENMLVGHGREPYSGERKVVVSMADPISWIDLGRSLTTPNVKQLHHTLSSNIASEDKNVSRLNQSNPAATSNDLEDFFLKAVAEELELEEAVLEDAFRDIGGDSMAASIIIEVVQEETGIELPIDAFFKAENLGSLVALLK